jgi:methylated-DNA-[protein]-cysteine S-methyltransferase
MVPVFSVQLPDTPLGTLDIWATQQGVRRVGFHQGAPPVRTGETLSSGDPPSHVSDLLEQVRDYFAGGRRGFDVELDLGPLTPFQIRVYDRLRETPYGRVVTYGQVARDIGEGPRAARAVGQAVGANPVCLLIPCHRVVASDGSLSGYAGGLARKAALLRLEGVEVDGTKRSSKVRPEILRLPL